MKMLIRSDSTKRMGTGHIMRCIALAQAWQDLGGSVTFVSYCESESLRKRIIEEGFDFVPLENPYPNQKDLDYTRNILAEHPEAWVVLDGYHFDEKYQQLIKDAGYRLLVIDDIAHLSHYYADIVLNQNLHAGSLKYSCEGYTKLLLGTKYVLLRREFWKWREWKREIPDVARKILVTMGGSDPDNVTLKVIQALKQVKIEGLEAVVVVGGSNSHYEELKFAVQDSPFPIHLKKNVNNIAELMAWSDVAISSGGTVIWELVFMGLPIIGLSRAQQEKILLQETTKRGVSINLDDYNYITNEEICEAVNKVAYNKAQRLIMSQIGRSIVDGYGSMRVINIILNKRGTDYELGR